MIKERLIELISIEQFEEFEEYVSKLELEELANALKEINKKQIVPVFTKLPHEISSKVFTMLPADLQAYLVENITDIDFESFSETLLSCHWCPTLLYQYSVLLQQCRAHLRIHYKHALDLQ